MAAILGDALANPLREPTDPGPWRWEPSDDRELLGLWRIGRTACADKPQADRAWYVLRYAADQFVARHPLCTSCAAYKRILRLLRANH